MMAIEKDSRLNAYITRVKGVDSSMEAALDDYVRVMKERLGIDQQLAVLHIKNEITGKKIRGFMIRDEGNVVGIVLYRIVALNGVVGFLHHNMERLDVAPIKKAFEIGVCKLSDTRGIIILVHKVSGCRNGLHIPILLEYAVNDMKKMGVGAITCEIPCDMIVAEKLKELGFKHFFRSVMVATNALDIQNNLPVPDGYRLVKWDDRYLNDSTKIIFKANAGTIDQEIIPEYTTYERTVEFVRGIRYHGGGASFNTEASLIALKDKKACGVVLLTSTDDGVGYIPEIAVAEAHRGKGIGKALLYRALTTAFSSKIKQVKLTVTGSNKAAVSLYKAVGFRVTHNLLAAVLKME